MSCIAWARQVLSLNEKYFLITPVFTCLVRVKCSISSLIQPYSQFAGAAHFELCVLPNVVLLIFWHKDRELSRNNKDNALEAEGAGGSTDLLLPTEESGHPWTNTPWPEVGGKH